jgi:SulP family sulfate permease
VPVQPLKAFAAAAIALGLSAETIAAGALLMSAAMAALAVTGLAGWLAARFPLVLVRGIQAAVALLLARAAIELAQRGNWDGLPAIAPEASVAMALCACALVIAQLPLTFGNSVVATADAERAYFGARAERATPNRLAASIGGWNLAAGLAGGLPVCHGAGGVTAHYKLGARTAGATLAAGALFIALALLVGDSLPALLQVLAPGALAGMLLFVAIQHAMLAASLDRVGDRLVAAGVGALTVVIGSLAIGFAVGVAALAARAAWRARAAAPSPARA